MYTDRQAQRALETVLPDVSCPQVTTHGSPRSLLPNGFDWETVTRDTQLHVPIGGVHLQTQLTATLQVKPHVVLPRCHLK